MHHSTTSLHESALQSDSTATEAATTPQQRVKKRKSWTKVSSASSYLQFEYNHHKESTVVRSVSNLHLDSHPKTKSSCVNDMANYGLYRDEYHEIESAIQNSKNKNIKQNLKQLNRHSLQSIKPPTFDGYKRKRRYNKYKITDIFASNASFILDHEYNESDICNLILNNSTQTQTKIRFLKSIWPHILRVTTRVLDGSKFRCPICLDEELSIGRITECGHCFCGMCLLHHLSANNEAKTDHCSAIDEIETDQDIANYNFFDLFGYCPLCHEYVSFEQCRPLTVIRCRDYKVGDMADMVLIERRKGEQPRFTLNHHNAIATRLNISTFRKFETERMEREKCEAELVEIDRFMPSSDPLYEAPYLRLLAIQVQQYKMYITKQREEYKIQCHRQENNVMATKKAEARYRKKKYVYQTSDGQLIFLHPHNYNMLKHDVHYEFTRFPSVLSQCRILQIETYTQSYELRRKYPFLAFIPVDIAFSFVEVDLSSMVKPSTVKYFEKQNMNRHQFRIEKEKLMEQEVKHKQIMEEQRIAAQKQKYARPQIDIHDYNEFPSLIDSDNSDSNSSFTSNTFGSNHINSPQTRSWSQITITPKKSANNNNNNNNNNSNHNSNSNSKKKKRKRRRSKKKNNKKCTENDGNSV